MKSNQFRMIALVMAICCLFVCVPCSANGSAGSSINEHRLSTNYVYSITPSDERWGALSVSERFEICDIPDDYYLYASTDALLESIIDNPFTTCIFAYNSLSQGIERLIGRFNAVDELFMRDNFLITIETYINQIIIGITSETEEKPINYYIAIAFRDYYEKIRII